MLEHGINKCLHVLSSINIGACTGASGSLQFCAEIQANTSKTFEHLLVARCLSETLFCMNSQKRRRFNTCSLGYLVGAYSVYVDLNTWMNPLSVHAALCTLYVDGIEEKKAIYLFFFLKYFPLLDTRGQLYTEIGYMHGTSL